MKKSGSNIVIQIVLGLIIADILCGFLHWFEDNYIDYCVDIPILNDIARHNEMHHYFPRSMFVYTNIEHAKYTLPMAIGFILFLYIVDRSLFVKYPYFLLSLFFFLSISNILHSIVHRRDCENNCFFLALQKVGLLCSHDHHSIHHTVGKQKYCVMLTINNYILDGIYFWNGLEYLIYLITNKKTNEKLNYDDYSMIHNHMHENAKIECPDKPTKKDIDELFKKLDEYKKCSAKHIIKHGASSRG
jgi:hypothetical protein